MIMTFNACLALITSLVIVSTLNHMAKGKTPPAILLYGGLLAFVMACRRFPISRHKAGALDKASLIVSAVTLIAALALIP